MQINLSQRQITYLFQVVTLGIAGYLILVLSGCGFIYSETRALENEVERYRYMLSKDKWNDAKKYYHTKFNWVKYDGTVVTANAVDEWHNSLRQIPSRQSIEFVGTEIAKAKDNVYIVTTTVSVFCSDTHELATHKWKISMRWGKIDGKWVLGQIKELSERKKTRS